MKKIDTKPTLIEKMRTKEKDREEQQKFHQDITKIAINNCCSCSCREREREREMKKSIFIPSLSVAAAADDDFYYYKLFISFK